MSKESEKIRAIATEVAAQLAQTAQKTATNLANVANPDHDLLLRLEENVSLNFQQVKEAIKELTDGTTTKISDHENRIRNAETNITKIMTWGTALVVMLGIIQFIVGKYF